MSELDKRRYFSKEKLLEFVSKIENTKKYLTGTACVYATGSFGRHEASPNSDLDIFIAGKSEETVGPQASRKQFTATNLLSHLDEICVQAELIKVARDFEFPDFSGDGRYLDRHSVHELVSTLGTEKDDVANTFTARLLLLLESKPLVEEDVYHEIIRTVIASYWRDFDDHSEAFMPAFLANDILRIWRTFCVNYEARTEREPEQKKASGKLKNYKLKHSRLLTCYSALLYLLIVYERNRTVTREDAFSMTLLTPTERLEWMLVGKQLNCSESLIESLLNQYGLFLERTNFPERDLTEMFMSREFAHTRMAEARVFGDTMYRALSSIGSNSDFYRLLVV